MFNVPGKQSKFFWEKLGVSKGKLNVLHSTIDTDSFSPKYKPFLLDFLYVGVLNKRKRVNNIIEAFSAIVAKYPKTKLGVVGNGAEYSKLKNLVRKLNIEKNVLFFGFQKEVRPFLHSSKIFVMFSKIEGLPVALMEAMSCQKIVIAPSTDNIPSVIDNDSTGFLLHQDNSGELQSKLLNAYENFEHLNPMGVKARHKIISDYSYSSAISKWEEILAND